MTTFNRTVKKDTINSYTITEHGYWDYKGNVSTSEVTTIDITLEQYYNVDSRYKINTHGVPHFILSSCILPNNKTYTSKKYALDKIGHDYILIEDYYYNYINRGEQVVDGKTGLMTNITNTNNIRAKVTGPILYAISKVIIKPIPGPTTGIMSKIAFITPNNSA